MLNKKKNLIYIFFSFFKINCFHYNAPHRILVHLMAGAHTIGQARCTTFRDRMYNDTNIDSSFAKTRQNTCPRTTGLPGDNRISPLDLKTPTAFDNYYYKNLISQKGLLRSDQQLFNGGSTDSLVKKYSEDTETFYSDFVEAIIKMGDLQPLTGSSGEIRKNCRMVNNQWR